MGLEQRLGHYCFDNPDQQGIPLSALERLHQFVDRYRQPVQTAIQGLTASTLILSGAQDLLPHPVFAQSLIQSTEVTEVTEITEVVETSMITTLTQELSDKITKEIVKPLAEKGVNIDLTGELLTNAWVDDQGNRNILYRNVWFMVGMDGQLTVVNALTELGKLGLDQQLNQEYSGIDPIPPKSDQPISVDQLDPNVQSVISTLSQSFKFNAQVTGAKSYGLFNVFRIGDQSGDKLAIIQILGGEQAGQIQLTNIGLGLINTSLIPQAVILSPLPFATGGGTTPTPEQTAQLPSELFNTTPQATLTGVRFPNSEIKIYPKAGETAAKTDEFFINEAKARVKFQVNTQLRSGIGTVDLKPCPECKKTPERWGILKGVVDPADPKTLIMEINIFRPDYKLDPAYREQLADSIAGTVGLELSKVIYGKSLLDGLSQEQANHIGQLSYRLQYEIRPLELITPTSG